MDFDTFTDKLRSRNTSSKRRVYTKDSQQGVVSEIARKNSNPSNTPPPPKKKREQDFKRE